jgi:hypothetical protein
VFACRRAPATQALSGAPLDLAPDASPATRLGPHLGHMRTHTTPKRCAATRNVERPNPQVMGSVARQRTMTHKTPPCTTTSSAARGDGTSRCHGTCWLHHLWPGLLAHGRRTSGRRSSPPTSCSLRRSVGGGPPALTGGVTACIRTRPHRLHSLVAGWRDGQPGWPSRPALPAGFGFGHKDLCRLGDGLPIDTTGQMWEGVSSVSPVDYLAFADHHRAMAAEYRVRASRTGRVVVPINVLRSQDPVRAA